MPLNLDPRRLLNAAPVYRAFCNLACGAAERVAREFIRATPGERVLDIGCGPGDRLRYLPEVEYVGFDLSERYVAAARRRFGTRGEFHCQDVCEVDPGTLGRFDLVLAMGIVHHLDDLQAYRLFELAETVLRPGGRLVTFDGCYTDDQPWICRRLLSWDRGRHVRTQDRYLALAREVFSDIEVEVRHDLLRIPYTHIILQCRREAPVPQGTAGPLRPPAGARPAASASRARSTDPRDSVPA